MKAKKLLVIDGNSILNRAFYGIRPLTTKDGLFTHAVYGMANIILKQTDTLKPDYVAVAFDVHAPTFRHEASADYKATRKGMPEELAVQLPYAKELCSALGFTVAEKPGYEADDILGTLSREAAEAGAHAYLLTGDKDSLQLITDDISVMLASTGATTEYTPSVFFDKYGVKSTQFVDVKALMGDSSDNIPGVAGIGEKTALKLIAEYGDLDKLYESYEGSALTAGIKNKLAAGKESAYTSRFLARIVTDAPIGITLEDTAWGGYDKEKLLPLLNRLELFSLSERLLTEEEGEAQTECCEYTDTKGINKDTLYGVALDGEYALFASEGEHLRIPLSECKDFFENEEYKLIVPECKAVWHTLMDRGITLASCVFDPCLAAYVLDSTASDYTTAHLAAAYLNGRCSDTADEAYRLYSVLSEKLREIDSENIYYDIEHPCAFVLARMERAGFLVDVKGLAEYSAELTKTAEALQDEIYLLAGEEFNINSPKQLGHVLFEKLEIPAPKKTKSGYSTAADVLEKLRPFYPIVDMILEYRKVTKLNSTYAVGLTKAADGEGRVHTTFQQTVTATGRLSSVEPNLQNIPIKTELGRALRRYFIPKKKGSVLVDADYSQIELRLLAHVSGDENMIEAFKSGVDVHTVTASQAFGVPVELVTPELRKRAKAVNFGIIYGISDFTLGQDIGVTKRQAKEYMDSYMAAYPKVSEYLDRVKEEARAQGYVTTMMGRRRYIPELSSGKAMLRAFGERVAMNSPLQGAAADIMKLAMVNVDKALRESGIDAHLILQVHDELVLESARECAEEASRILQSEMENVITLRVPLIAETTVGETWYENK